MINLKIGSIGYNYSHDSDFVMDRPNGVGCCLFLLIKEPANFVINGVPCFAQKNSFVFFTPETPCTYRAAEERYCDDWMYFDMEKGDKEELEKLGLPLNKIVYAGEIEELSKIMHILAFEHYSAEMHHNEIERCYIELLLLKLSRSKAAYSASGGESFKEKNYRLTQLRTKIFTMPESVPSVDEMAEELGMSRSGFQHLYKRLFGVSVMSDAIKGRLDRAKRLLSSTNLTVREIGERCGYSNEFNFMRQFKDNVGKTPTEYRKIL
ncbi:MAG: AraC family transcriptional regulator [Oscillospiraceae bacterium]|nr:AraC family transcriptional regulator [Oscillospiraceae bacterium]